MSYTGHTFTTSETLTAGLMNALDAGVLERYIKPTAGIPKSDMASSVQTSLSAADSAIQGVKLNGTTITPSSNVVNVVLSDYRTATAQAAIDSTKVDKVTGKGLSESDFTYKEKRQLANIAALLKGTEYTVETGTSPAYTQTVPTGAQTYAEIGSVGGRTVAVRQRLRNSSAEVVLTGESGSSRSKYYYFSTTPVLINSAHSYAFVFTTGSMAGLDTLADTDTALKISAGFVNTSPTSMLLQAQMTKAQCSDGTHFVKFDSAVTTDVTSGSSCVYVYFQGGLVVGTASATITLSNAMLFDLTELFGSGNEPTTLAGFQAAFPATYYSVDDWALVTAPVTSIVSKDDDEVTLQTVAVPSDVQAMTGYGWSAGSVCNEVDWTNKQYIQRVGRVDLGTIPENKYTWYSGTYSRYSAEIDGMKIGSKSVVGNIENANLIISTHSDIYNHRYDRAVAVNPNITGITLRYSDYDDNISGLKAALSGSYLYYELATPVYTPISSYLPTDSFIQVEAGGTVTFTQTTAPYIPVPNTVNYMVKLSDSI